MPRVILKVNFTYRLLYWTGCFCWWRWSLSRHRHLPMSGRKTKLLNNSTPACLLSQNGPWLTNVTGISEGPQSMRANYLHRHVAQSLVSSCSSWHNLTIFVSLRNSSFFFVPFLFAYASRIFCSLCFHWRNSPMFSFLFDRDLGNVVWYFLTTESHVREMKNFWEFI